MRFVHYAALAAMLAPVPAQAAGWPDGQRDSRIGAFVGARVQLRLGGSYAGRARTSLAIAPTRSTYSSGGEIRTRIGEGVALSLMSGAKPSLTLAGVRADATLGLQRQRHEETDQKLGISTAGWVAIGVGTVAITLGGAYLLFDEAMDCDEDEECS